MPIPPFKTTGWLPPGHFMASWEDVEQTFGGPAGGKRSRLLSELLAWRDELRITGISGFIVLNGSFISQKEAPGDIDMMVVYDADSEKLVETSARARELLSMSGCKERGLGDVFMLSAEAVRKYPALCRLDGFDRDKVTRELKGVLEVEI